MIFMHFLCFGPQYHQSHFSFDLLNKKRKNLLICVIQLIETIQSVAQVQARDSRIEIKLQKGRNEENQRKIIEER